MMHILISYLFVAIRLIYVRAGESLDNVLSESTVVNDIQPRYHLFHHMERHIPRDTFVRGERSPSSAVHEVLIAVHQNNLPELKKSILERATPGNPLYQKWYTFHEIGAIVQNQEGYDKVKSWLDEYKVTIISVTPYKEYIKASAPVGTWEKMLKTEFYQHEDLTRKEYLSPEEENTLFHRASEYSIPAELKESIEAIFHTVQTPPRYNTHYGKSFLKQAKKGKKPRFRTDYRVNPDVVSGLSFSSLTSSPSGSFDKKKEIKVDLLEQIGADVNIAFLDSVYQVTSNIASPLVNQSVFETNNEYFRQSDLKTFQTVYDLTVQAAISVGGHSTTSTCSLTSSGPTQCGEGSLDIQYIMGMAQTSGSIFWWVPGTGDAFVTWIDEVAAEEFPPQSNSISWGELEVLVSSSTISSWETEAMKLAGKGVTISVASGDSGAPNYYSNTCLCPSVVRSMITCFIVFTSIFVRILFQEHL
jgi:subtilase family serine protease